MKKVAVGFVVLVVLVVGALLVLPSFWDWNAEKGRMAALVKEHTGRDLQIAGDVSLHLLPKPAFSAREVTLANLAEGSGPAMVRLEELRISIGLLPLLRGEILVNSVTLVKPEVLLEVLPDGRANWDFAGAGGEQPQAEGVPATAGDADPAGRPIRVDSFLIEDGVVHYRDARSGREETLGDLNAELAADSLAGPFGASGSGVYQNVPLEFDFSLGQLVEGGATPLSLSLRLPQAAAEGNFVGALSRHEDLQTLRGRLQAEGESLAQFLQALPLEALPAESPGLLAQPFSLSSEIGAGGTEASAEAVRLVLGSLTLEGRLAAVLGDTPDVTASFTTKTVDLDALLALAPAQRQAAAAGEDAPPPAADGGAAVPSDAAGGEAPARLPTGFSASVELSAQALLYRGQTVRQLQAAARLEDGRLQVTRASVQLPGSSDAAVTGTLTADGQGPRFSGQVDAESDNLRGLLAWLGVDVAMVPAERLRRMVLKTGFEAGGDQVVLRNTDLRLDVSRLTGGAAIALRQRPGLGIALNIDRLNLDAYLPAQDAAAVPAAPAEPDAPGDSAQQSGDPAAATRAPLGLPLLGRFDANLDLRVGQLTYKGLPLEGLRLDATLQRGGVVVRELSVADLAGSRGAFSGSLANVDREPSIDGSIDLSVATLSRLVKTLGIDTGRQLPLESFSLSGAVNGNRDDLRFDQHLAALGGTLRATGRLQPAAAGAPLVDAAFELDHPNLSVLLGELLRDSSLPAGLGPVSLKGRTAAAATEINLTGLEGKLAGVDLRGGDIAVSLAGPRPLITANLTTGDLPLAALAAPAAAGQPGKTGGGSGNGSGAAASGGERWSRKPIDLAALRAVDAEVTLNAAAILADRLRLTKAQVEAGLKDGLLDLRRFTAEAYGGSFSLTGQADAREAAGQGLAVTAAVDASKVDLKGLLGDLADSDRFSGPVSLQGAFDTRGVSQAALVSALAGTATLDGSVTVAAKVEEQAGALVLDILGQKVREVRGLTDSTTMLFGAFAGAPAQVDGTFVIQKGIARSDDLKVRGRDAVALTKGSADLPAWRLDSLTEVFRDADPETPYLTARLRGPLDEPNVTIGGQPFQRREEAAPGAEPAPAPGETPQQQPLKPEELLKDGLKNLLKGLGG